MSEPFASGRHGGILVPLFSIPSSVSWGIGEIPDLMRFARWLHEAGQDFVQLLPVTAIAEGETSPYSALSAMAIDHVYIGLEEVQDFCDTGGERGLRPDLRDRLARLRASRCVEYSEVRDLKHQALDAAFERFVAHHWERDTQRASELRSFIARERWWLDDYALFRALRKQNRCQAWWEWDEGLRRRDPDALAAARQAHARDVLRQQYLQWMADSQWHDVRASAGIGLFGDYPFMVSRDSADVWARQDDFLHDGSVGTPPDAFSETGQDWGLPVYRWDEMARNDFTWLRQRAERSASLYDGYRIDHLVGFYRTYVRPPDDTPFFTPATQAEQLALGERLMTIFKSSGPVIIAEDLGVVPDFVRASLGRLGLPGYRVMRWEREWEEPGRPFRDPAEWPACSVATSGTHDTEPLAEWWENAEQEERREFLKVPALAALRLPADARLTPALRDAILHALIASGSRFVILPLGDVFGWPDRINTPASVSDDNWRWRLPWPVDRLLNEPEARERAAFLRREVERTGRRPALRRSS
ncbi:MAG TPA: 4-alpha-glucanotransferase [Vicinamibacterales bacterium]|nr:4-alpha-glucanotransferase [Vicinamibacterales bacterium]